MSGKVSRSKARCYLYFIDFTRNHPRLSRAALFFLDLLPGLRRLPCTTTRLYLGGRALDDYDVDLEGGKIRLAGLEWRIHGSEYIEITHRVLGRKMGTEKARRTVYEVAFQTMQESLERLDYGNLFPSFAIPLVREPLNRIRLGSDQELTRLHREMESALLRLCFSELGWGNPEFDHFPIPSKVTLRHSVEVDWISRAQDPYWEGLRDEPVCYAFAGMLAGFVSHIAGERYEAREMECAVTGSPSCVFTLEKGSGLES